MAEPTREAQLEDLAVMLFSDARRAGARILARSKAEGDLLGEIRAKADAQAAQERGTR